MSENELIAVSFGGGVQSTALAWMVLSDDERIRPFGRPRLWVFADTGDEPRRVYEHVEEWGNRITDAGMDFVTVRSHLGSLSRHCIDRAEIEAGGKYANIPPLYVMGSNDKPAISLRGCTDKFKIRPIRKELRKRAKGRRIALWLGISRDEAHRSRNSDVQWIRNVYPLIDGGLHRTDCIRALEDAGIDAPRSACVFCPFHSNEEWRRVREDPEDWKAAIAFERRIHHAYLKQGRVFGLNAMPFLHRSLSPIDLVPLDDQTSFAWGNECAGVCGV